MEIKKRNKLNKQLKEFIKQRQKGKCVCCDSQEKKEYHHVNPICLGGKDSSINIVMLCSNHHKLLHLADPYTCIKIYEYVYYLYYRKLPDNPCELLNDENFINIIKKD